MEMEAEKERLLQRQQRRDASRLEQMGETVIDLVITEQDRGLGDRHLLRLEKRNQKASLPWTRLKVGSPVVLSLMDDTGPPAVQGVISGKSRKSLQVAVTHLPSEGRLRVDLSSNDITHQRHLHAIKRAKNASGRLGRLRDVSMGVREPASLRKIKPLRFQLPLDPSQQDAVRMGLATPEFGIIHGPPGTGKTTTVVELIIQAILRGETVLACAPSNTAVDNLVEKLVAENQHVVRLGHAARVDEKLRHASLDHLVSKHENMTVIRDIQRDADALLKQAERFTRAKPDPGYRKGLREEAKRLKSHIRLLEQQAADHILDGADCICATTSFDDGYLRDRWFDLVVIDEACQTVEPGCWQPIAFGERVILAGDHFQLPPTVVCTEAMRQGFGLSLLERMVSPLEPDYVSMLKTQYRMHDQIKQFSSEKFYGDQLESAPAVAQHLLAGLPHVESNELTTSPLKFIDTAGAEMDDELEPDGESKRNPGEARVVMHFCEQLVAAGVKPNDIAVIVPYAAQTRLIKKMSNDLPLEIDTVDGFQGREKEVVVVSLVRSNPQGEIGFLKDERRINVAITRAKRKLIVIGDSATLAKHDFFRDLIDYFELQDAYSSVWELGLDL